MTDHLSPAILNLLADGELSAEEFAITKEHLDGCSSCTTNALTQMLLKSATAKAGHRYTLPPHLLEQLSRQTRQAASPKQASQFRIVPRSVSQFAGRFNALGWVAAAVLLVISLGAVLILRSAQQTANVSAEYASLVTEVCDQHIATLAANSPPQVLSSDRHTVKPWFQGKLPFSFNLPESLPHDTTLDGANLTYLRNQPVAQLLYSIAKHRVSIFVRRRTDSINSKQLLAEHSGFHVMGFRTDDLEAVAVSDVDPARLSDLIRSLEQSQATDRKPTK